MKSRKLFLKSNTDWIKAFAFCSVLTMAVSCSDNEDLTADDSKSQITAASKADVTYQAEDYDAQNGVIIAGGGSRVGYIQNDDWIRFDDFDHSDAESITVNASSGSTGGTIEFRKGSENGNLLAEVDIPNTGGWGNMQEFTVNITGTSTNSDLYVVFTGGSGYLLDIDSFVFNSSSSSTATNLALDGTATQSSNYSTSRGLADLAIDGDTNGAWSNRSVTHTQNEAQAWWQVRLASDTNIEEIVIWNRTDSCCMTRLSNFDVFVYNSAGELQYKEEVEETPYPSKTIYTPGVIGNRVRIKLKSDSSPLSLAEVQVFGSSSGDGGETTTTTDGDSPGDVLGLSEENWKLNGFDDTPSNSATYFDDVLAETGESFSTYENADYFYTDGEWTYFKCYRGLDSSENSLNPRVELRELFEGEDTYVWDGDNGSHSMSWTVRVDQLPEDTDGSGGVLCFGQIHGPSEEQGYNDDGVDVDDTIRVQFIGEENQSSGDVRIKISGYITETQEGSSRILDGTYQLDTEYDFNITMNNGYLTVDVDGSQVFDSQMNTSADKSYFKVGNYLQSVKDSSFDGSYGLVGVKNLSVTHPDSDENK